MIMVRVKLYKNNVLRGIGQVGMCRHAGESLDVILKHGYQVRLDQFDPMIDPISTIQHDNFYKTLTEVMAYEKIGGGKT